MRVTDYAALRISPKIGATSNAKALPARAPPEYDHCEPSNVAL